MVKLAGECYKQIVNFLIPLPLLSQNFQFKQNIYIRVKKLLVHNNSFTSNSYCLNICHIDRKFSNFSIRLTALDPAGPFFTKFSTDAYSRNDFLFVDSIHTSAGLAGEFEVR